jgi:hypothetical protein
MHRRNISCCMVKHGFLIFQSSVHPDPASVEFTDCQERRRRRPPSAYTVTMLVRKWPNGDFRSIPDSWRHRRRLSQSANVRTCRVDKNSIYKYIFFSNFLGGRCN